MSKAIFIGIFICAALMVGLNAIPDKTEPPLDAPVQYDAINTWLFSDNRSYLNCNITLLDVFAAAALANGQVACYDNPKDYNLNAEQAYKQGYEMLRERSKYLFSK